MPVSFDAEPDHSSARGPGLLTATRRHPVIVIVSVVVAVTLALLITMVMPTRYTAEARLVLGDNNDVTVFRNVAGLNPTAKAQNAAQIMRSQAIYDRASEILEGKVSADRIEKSVTIAPGDNNPLVTITATSNTANRTRAIANSVGQAYLDVTKERDQERSERARAALKGLQLETLAELTTVNGQIDERVKQIERRARENVENPADRARFVQNELNTDARYRALTAQADRLTLNLSEVRQKLLETRVDGELLSVGIDTLYKAAEPSSPASPSLRRNLLIGAALGLLIGVALAWRRLERRRGVDQAVLTDVLGAPMLGHVKRDRQLHGATALVDVASGSELADDLSVLASSLVGHARRRGLRGAVVTSLEQGEGKTVLALNLAAAARSAGHDVVLVDGDVRNSTLTGWLGLGSSPGLRDLLSGPRAHTLGEVEVGPDRILPVLPVGSARADYDPMSGIPDLTRPDGSTPTAIVDTTSVFDDPFTLALASGRDAGLVLVVTPVTRQDDLARLRSRAELAGSTILGYVLNEHRPRRRRRARPPAQRRRTGQRVAEPTGQPAVEPAPTP